MLKRAALWPLFLCTPVLSPGGQAAPDVPLCLVFLQQRLHLNPQRPVVQRQSFADILMDGRLADAEFLCGGAHCRSVFYQVKSQLFGSLFQIFSNRAPLPCRYCPMYMTPRYEICRPSILTRKGAPLRPVAGAALLHSDMVFTSALPAFSCPFCGGGQSRCASSPAPFDTCRPVSFFSRAGFFTFSLLNMQNAVIISMRMSSAGVQFSM